MKKILNNEIGTNSNGKTERRVRYGEIFKTLFSYTIKLSCMMLLCVLLLCVLLLAGCGANGADSEALTEAENVEATSGNASDNNGETVIAEDAGGKEDGADGVADSGAGDADGDYGNAFEFAAALGAGINIGNSLDCYDANCDGSWEVPETYWGNPEISDELIRKIASDGFKTVRIPITWMHHVDADFNIQSQYMARVRHLVDISLENGMFVIIDIHHDTWTYPSYDNRELALSRIEKIWSQVASEFSDYDERLIFEGVNEPREKGQGNEWTDGSQMANEVINDFMQRFVDTVRKAGGKNADRYLMITDYCNTYRKNNLDAMRVLDDDKLIVSIHFYCPYNFVSNRDGSSFDDGRKREFDDALAVVKEFSEQRNIPVVITEWGTFGSLDKAAREEYASYAASEFAKAGISQIWWDNGNTGQCDDGYGLYDRGSAECRWPEVVKAIVGAP